VATAQGDAVDNPFRVTGVMMQYYYVCERELWFESRNVEIDRENASVARGLASMSPPTANVHRRTFDSG